MVNRIIVTADGHGLSVTLLVLVVDSANRMTYREPEPYVPHNWPYRLRTLSFFSIECRAKDLDNVWISGVMMRELRLGFSVAVARLTAVKYGTKGLANDRKRVSGDATRSYISE